MRKEIKFENDAGGENPEVRKQSKWLGKEKSK